ncbi:hypothetical protein F511_47740 [Dorcoceras hygrometricum]|uniref:Uncharacterized protein n=1 Tax=Dorcoceras hygrometricum TaxID=472368 RepID=A0A2Z6ZQC6_9LAMI|nr:hypothetical protein F511_47740 [Dorcoceras hygrometricum]
MQRCAQISRNHRTSPDLQRRSSPDQASSSAHLLRGQRAAIIGHRRTSGAPAARR